MRNVTHEPPALERQVHEWVLGTVGIGNVEAIHARVPHAWENVKVSVNRIWEKGPHNHEQTLG